MCEEHPINGDLPDFSSLSEIINRIQEMKRPVIQNIQKIQEVMRPITETIERFQSPFKGFVAELSKVIRPLLAAEKLGKNQCVYWDYMTDDFVDVIVTTDNVNETLQKLVAEKKYITVDETIKKCRISPFLHKYKRLFNQSISAFKNNQSDLAVIGLVSIIDGLLTDVSGIHTTKIATRASAILEKLKQNEAVGSDDYALLMLVLTFKNTMEIFSANSDFTKKEPSGLNRHWIMHGRSLRKKTSLDCVKLINLIYGTLIINELGKKEEANERDE